MRKFDSVEPRPSVLIESMRDIGYSLQTAVADVIDNSITAGANRIDLLVDIQSDLPIIGILDNGCGMSMIELKEAMRPGTKNPLENRSKHDLGRFGLGLKTASFSQCRRLTILTSCKGVTSCAVWDLDIVAAKDKWIIEILSDFEKIPWSNKLDSSGTLVVWQKLDRLVGRGVNATLENTSRQIKETASHLELVFHRFLAGEADLKMIKMFVNGRNLIPHDPFNSKHPATISSPKETYELDGKQITLQSFTLPHHKKITPDEWEKYAGTEGYVKNQGFYLYREKRLIVHGTWFGLIKQTEPTKLARVKIDMSNGMDALWKIDVKKASAQPPTQIRNRLRQLIEGFAEKSKRVYVSRGTKLVSENRLPVWVRIQNKNQIIYKLNLEHPAFTKLISQIDEPYRQELQKLFRLVASTIPIDAIYSDISSNSNNVSGEPLSEHDLLEIVKATYFTLLRNGGKRKEIELMMQSAEPFLYSWEKTLTMLQNINEIVEQND